MRVGTSTAMRGIFDCTPISASLGVVRKADRSIRVGEENGYLVVLVDLHELTIARILLGEQKAAVRHRDRTFRAVKQIANELHLRSAVHDARDVGSGRIRR